MKDLAVVIENQPGGLAALGETLGSEKINIEGLCGVPGSEKIIHILVEDHEKAISVLTDAGYKIRAERSVLVLDIGSIAKKPGAGGRLFRRLALEGINIRLVYFAVNNRLVLAVDDIHKARAII